MRSAEVVLLILAALSGGCERDMIDQPRYEFMSPASRWSDGSAARPIPKGAVSRDSEELDSVPPGRDMPIAWTAAALQRGRERFDIYCSPCHGALGDGLGMIVQRGFQRPPSFHDERLRRVPTQHFYQVITQGFGAMQEYGSDVAASDRWRIAAYIKALQRSQHASLSDVPDSARAALEQRGP